MVPGQWPVIQFLSDVDHYRNIIFIKNRTGYVKSSGYADTGP